MKKKLNIILAVVAVAAMPIIAGGVWYVARNQAVEAKAFTAICNLGIMSMRALK